MNKQSIDVDLIRAVAEAADIGTPPRKFVKLLEFVHGRCLAAYHEGRTADPEFKLATVGSIDNVEDADLGIELIDPVGPKHSVAEAPATEPDAQPVPPDRKGHAWSKDEVQRALDMDKQGMTARKIAAELGRPIEATRMKLKRMGPAARGRYGDAPPPRGAAVQRKDAWTTEEEQKLIDMKVAGKSIREMAKVLGRGDTAVSMRIRLMRGRPFGPKLPKESWTDAEDRQLMDGRAAERPYSDIATEMGRSVRSLQNRYRRLTKSELPAAAPPPEVSPLAPAEPAEQAAPKEVCEAAEEARETAFKPQVSEPEPVGSSQDFRVLDLGDCSALSARQRRILHHLNLLSDDFAPIDDQDIVEGLTSGRKAEALADEMGCAAREVVNRWKRLLTDEVVNFKGQITLDGQADLVVAVRHLAKRAASNG